MTGAQMKRLRKSVGMTRAEFSRLIHVHASTVMRWEEGRLEIPDMAAIAIEAMVKKVSQNAE